MFSPFSTIVVGLDSSDDAHDAISQARRLLAPDGRLVAVVASEERWAVHGGFDAPRLDVEFRVLAEKALEEVRAHLADLPEAEALLRHGPLGWCLRNAAQEAGADLVVVPSHQHGRMAGILFNDAATEITREEPQSILLARNSADRLRSIVVGVDGSSESLAALTIAGAIAESSEGAQVRAIVADGGKRLDRGRLDSIHGLVHEAGSPVPSLARAGEAADLVVVGSRGLHGLRSLGSVSERIAHAATCSVLIVRGKAAARALAQSQEALGV